MKAPVDKQMRHPLTKGNAHRTCLTLCLAHIEKYFAFVDCEWEGKDVGRVGFFACPPKLERRQAIRLVHAARERIAADDEAQLIPFTQNSTRDTLKGNVRQRAACPARANSLSDLNGGQTKHVGD